MLSIWLPLNGDLHNQGLSNITATNNGATVDNNGKIGKCYSFDGNDDFINLGNIGSYFDGSAFSICFWIFSLENKTRAAVFSSYGLSSTSNFFGLELNSSNNNYCNNNLRFDWLGSDTYSPDDFVTYNAWTHICVTYDGVNQIKMYKNGTLIQTSTRVLNAIPVGNTYYLGRDSRTGSTAFNGRLNDFRIYDHCLSPRECKQVSTALVLHYPLAMPGGENLYNHSKDFSGTWVNGANWVTDSEQYNGFVVKKKSSAWGGLAQNVPCSNGDIFTISFYAKVDSGGNILSIHRSSLGNVVTGLTILGGNFTSGTDWVTASQTATSWKKYWATVQITSTDITYLQWRIENSVANKFLYVCGMKLERGSHPTPWLPNPADAEYTALGFDDGIEYDVSGYGHNGTKVGTITYDSDTPRYNTSVVFPNNCNTYIYTTGLKQQIFTWACWFKVLGEGSATSQRILDEGRDTGSRGTEIWVNKAGTTLSYGSHGVFGSTAILLNTWYHIAMTCDGNNRVVYLNGSQISTGAYTADTDYAQSSDAFVIGKMSYSYTASTAYFPFNGQVSDVRIYSTALSADDVLELYHTPISLSNNGALLTQGELVES